MYPAFLVAHSLVRWLVLLGLLYGIARAASGLIRNRQFSRMDNMARHWTATLAHVQLMIGIVLYTKSPLVKYFWKSDPPAAPQGDFRFYGWIHISLMLTAIVLITIGSALAKRRSSDHAKFTTMLSWFSVALLIICVAIPWPFSPLAQRPYLRTV